MLLAVQRSKQAPALQLSPSAALHEAPSIHREPSAAQVWICCAEDGLHRAALGTHTRQPTPGTHVPEAPEQVCRSVAWPPSQRYRSLPLQ